MLWRALAVVLLLWSVVASALPVTAQSDAPWSTELRVLTPTYVIETDAIRAPGYGLSDAPGAPALPMWSTVVELPAAGEFVVSYESVGAAVLDRLVSLAAAPVPDRELLERSGWDVMNAPSVAPTVDRPDAVIYQADAFYPASPVVVGEEQWQRGQRLLALRVFPFQYNPVSKRVRYHPDVQISIRVTPAETQPTEGEAALIDPTANPAASTAGALRIHTGARGLYRLTYDDLLAAGAPLGSVDVNTFALSYLGQPVAIEVTGNGNALFEPGELVVFYAEPYQGRYQNYNVYWFTYGGEPGLRMDTRSVAPTGSEPLVITITQTVQIERNRVYESTFPLPQDADHWFDNRLSPDIATGILTVTRTYDLMLDDALFEGVARVQAAVHGGANRPPNPDKSVAIYLNDNLVTTHQWEGLTYTTVDQTAPAVWLAAATPQVRLVAALSQLPGIDFYSIAPDWISVTYPALADAEGDQIYIEAVAPGANQVAVSGFTTPDVQVYDLRNPAQPVRLLTTAAEPAGGAYTLSFWDADLPDPTYFLSSYAALAAPLAIEPDAPSAWRTPGHEADYIAVVHSLLWNAIDPLLAHRAAEGMRIAKVDVQDIYDEWSYGRRDPEAIRSFLGYAYRCWNGAPCDPPPAAPPAPPQYVLLVGDGHYDFTGASAATLPNLIPPYLAHIDPWWGEMAADNRFVSVDGPNDFLPDMALGRLPATSPANVTAIVDKILAYETAPPGSWQERLIFVADNNLDPAGNFHAWSNDIRDNWLPPGYDDRTIYYNLDYTSGSLMRAAIKDSYNAGALMVQWFGHGNIVRWGSVEVFRTPDVATLLANTAWPLTVSYTCLNGYFFYPGSSQHQAVGEVLLYTPLRGSVVALAPSGLHVGGALTMFNRGVAQAVFQDRIGRAGQAADAARQYYFANAGSFMELIDTYIFFGDPATKLRLPTAELGNSTAEVSPAQALPGETLHYTVTVQNDGATPLSDVVVMVDYDQARGQVTASSPAAGNANGVLTWTLPSAPPGATTLTFDLLLDVVQPLGTTPIDAPTTVEAYGVPWATLNPASQVSAAPDLSGSSLAASRDWAPPGFPLTYTLTLSNDGSVSSAVWLTATLPTDLISVTSDSLVYNPALHVLTWQGAAPASQTVPLSFAGVITAERSACGVLDAAAMVYDELGQATPLAASVHVAVPDADCDGDVDIVDIQLVTAAWGAGQGDPAFQPRLDLNADGAIDVADILFVAARWQ